MVHGFKEEGWMLVSAGPPSMMLRVIATMGECSMKAAYFETTGAPEVIKYGDLPTPSPKEGELLIKVGAVSVNPIDTYIRSGMVQMNLPKPYIIGCDVAGTVERVGPQVKRFEVGDRVWGSNQGLLGRQGTFAEYACVHEDWLYPTSTKVTDQQAAAAALVGITAHLGLFRCARLQPGNGLCEWRHRWCGLDGGAAGQGRRRSDHHHSRLR